MRTHTQEPHRRLKIHSITLKTPVTINCLMGLYSHTPSPSPVRSHAAYHRRWETYASHLPSHEDFTGTSHVLYDTFAKYNSYKCCRKFQWNFPDAPLQPDQTICIYLKLFRARRNTPASTGTCGEKLDENGALLETYTCKEQRHDRLFSMKCNRTAEFASV